MFQKAHFLFTLLCSGTTIAIIILISLLYLHVSESSLSENQFRSFQNDISTITASLEETSSISIQWLEKIEAQNDFTIYIIDNGTPFLYNSLRSKNDSSGQYLLAESLEAYRTAFPPVQPATNHEDNNLVIYSIQLNNDSYDKVFVTTTASYALNIIPFGSHQFPASEPPGNFFLESHLRHKI